MWWLCQQTNKQKIRKFMLPSGTKNTETTFETYCFFGREQKILLVYSYTNMYMYTHSSELERLICSVSVESDVRALSFELDSRRHKTSSVGQSL